MLPSLSLLLYLWVGFQCIVILNSNSCAGDANVGCMEKERQALLRFKHGLKDPSNRLSSWVGDDCCGWKGIRCHNGTGHVVKLKLQTLYQQQLPIRNFIQLRAMNVNIQPEFESSCLSGEINPSLLELKYLKHLDLSMNCFGGMGIPKFLGSFEKLRYLNLSTSGFSGKVPQELGNLTTLYHLDLNDQRLPIVNTLHENGRSTIRFPPTKYDLHVDGLHWLSHLSSLQHLDMAGVNLSRATDWLLSVNMLPSLLSLQLRSCNLVSIPLSLSQLNFTSLSILDLSDNMLGPALPLWLFNISTLTSLNLGYNYFKDAIPIELGNLCNLQNLDMSSNFFGGEMHRYNECFKGCIRSSLEGLYLGSNELSGSLPDWLAQFTNLKSLGLDNNSLYGAIPRSLGKLSSLRELVLSENSLSGMIPSFLGRLSSLRTIDLRYNQLKGSIPQSIGQLSNLEKLYLNNNSFEGVLSEAHFSNLTKLKAFFLSSASLVMNVSSNWTPPFQLKHVIMYDCKLGPQFPPWLQTQKELQYLSLSNASISDTILSTSLRNLPKDIFFINLADNSITGDILENIGENATNLAYLSLSSNHLNGRIPLSICKVRFLMSLVLSNNHLTDVIPHCLGDLKYLRALNLQNNSLYGDIPSSVSHLSLLKSLHLSKNKLSGELPTSLKNCTSLVMLNLGENEFSGKIPTWIGERLTSLKFLFLRSNKFDGNLPPQLSLLSELQILDLAHNNISGPIPKQLFCNFSAMTIANRRNKVIYTIGGDLERIWVFWKGSPWEYRSTLTFMVSIDLSSNNLSGEIPEEITHLFGLKGLNLSKNYFTGSIPERIGEIRWMEVLDLSWNSLSGVIPHSLSNMTSLSHLNLSYNNLSGEIPSGNQLNTFDNSSIYIGNHFLCGTQVPNQCDRDGTYHKPQPNVRHGGIEDEPEKELLHISMTTGFAVGFLMVCGVLFIKDSWRIGYFRVVDDVGDWLYVAIVTRVAKFQLKQGAIRWNGLLPGPINAPSQ